MRILATLLLTAAFAPLQCGSDPDPTLRIEETPGEALYGLAARFRKEGNRDAWRTTLEELRARYPNSRHAVMAADDLAREAELFGASAPDPAPRAVPSGALSE